MLFTITFSILIFLIYIFEDVNAALFLHTYNKNFKLQGVTFLYLLSPFAESKNSDVFHKIIRFFLIISRLIFL